MSKKLVLNYEKGSSMVIDLEYVTDIIILEDDTFFCDSGFEERLCLNGLQKKNEKKLEPEKFPKRSWCQKS